MNTSLLATLLLIDADFKNITSIKKIIGKTIADRDIKSENIFLSIELTHSSLLLTLSVDSFEIDSIQLEVKPQSEITFSDIFDWLKLNSSNFNESIDPSTYIIFALDCKPFLELFLATNPIYLAQNTLITSLVAFSEAFENKFDIEYLADAESNIWETFDSKSYVLRDILYHISKNNLRFTI